LLALLILYSSLELGIEEFFEFKPNFSLRDAFSFFNSMFSFLNAVFSTVNCSILISNLDIFFEYLGKVVEICSSIKNLKGN
jgi:hypothetical protein